MITPVLHASELCKHHGKDEGLVRAVDRVNLEVAGRWSSSPMTPASRPPPTG